MSKILGYAEGFKCMTPLGIKIIDACFQAPHAAPGQRQMEMHYVH